MYVCDREPWAVALTVLQVRAAANGEEEEGGWAYGGNQEPWAVALTALEEGGG